MKNLATVAVLIITAFGSCTKENITGNGLTNTEVRPLANFSKVEVQGNTDIVIRQGNSFKVEVKAYTNLLPKLETTVSNGILKIGYKAGNYVVNDNSSINITMPALTKFVASGNSNVELLNGASLNFEVIVTGTSSIKAFGFTAKEAFAKIEGSGTIELAVTDKLRAKILGTGIMTYDGNPDVSSDITGTGKVLKR